MVVCYLVIKFKRMVMRKIMILLFMLVLSLPILAQVQPPENAVDVITNIDLYIGSLLGLAFLSTWIVGIVNGWLKVNQAWIRQAISWAVPIVLAVVLGFLLKLGFLAGEAWYITILYGLGAGLVSNGIFDIGFVKTAVLWLEQLINSKVK